MSAFGARSGHLAKPLATSAPRHSAEAPEAAALRFAGRGWPVFPCSPADKRPLIKGGFKAATTDADAVRAWWRKWPGAMIGVPTGAASGFFVLDIDRDAARGLDGFDALAALETAYGSLPETTAQRTPRGGEHRLFATSGIRIRNSASKLGAGLDVRGDGGYVIVAPSVNADGVPYVQVRDGDPVPAPQWLVDLVAAPAASGVPATRGPDRHGGYAAAALADELRAVEAADAGRRNDTLNRAAFNLGQLVGAGAITRGAVESALTQAAMRCGLLAEDGPDAVHRTIASGIDAGTAQPRELDARSRLGQPVAAGVSGPEKHGQFNRTEDGIALAFAETHKDDLRFCHSAARWYVWTGSRWQRDETKLAFDWARRICRNLNPTEDRRLARASTAAAVERFAQADPVLAVTSAVWDTDPWLLGTPDGVVDLRRGTIRPSRRHDFITRQTAVAPDFAAGRPLWDRFLDEVTLGDTALQRFLCQVAGYCLTGDVSEHALFFLCGPGGNGKSVFLNVVAGLMGDYATTAAMDSFTSTLGERHPTDLAMLQGARLVTASETEEGRAWAESRIKQLTGGDPIRARFMRQDFFEYRPQFKLVIVGNHKPVLRNVDDAARRRFNIVPFVHKPPTPDRDLERKLRDEWPAILAWAIEGARDWQRNGLVRPAVVAEATAEYFTEQDSVRQWVVECCETGGRNLSETTAQLFASWSDYAQANGEKPGSAKWLSQILQRQGYEPVNDTPGHRKKRGFLRIAVKPKDTSGQWQNRIEADDDAS